MMEPELSGEDEHKPEDGSASEDGSGPEDDPTCEDEPDDENMPSEKPRTLAAAFGPLVHTYYRKSWRDLFRSRRSFLLEYYLRIAEQHGYAVDEAMSPAEMREIICSQPGARYEVNAPIFDKIERSCPRIHRTVAAWFIVWMTLLPLAVPLVFAIPRLMRAWPNDWLSMATTVLLALLLIPVTMLVSIVCQAWLVKRFMKVLARMAPFALMQSEDVSSS